MFNQNAIESLKHYVYMLRDPRNNEIFYIGKGERDRVFQHVACSIDSDNQSDKLNRIREIHSENNKVEHFIVRHGLDDEKTAFEIEAALIDVLDIKNLTNLQSGHHSSEFGIMTTDEINSMYDAEELAAHDPIMLVNINKLYRRDMTQVELYEATRSSWVIGKKRREDTKYAISVYRGLTREVYEIVSWKATDKNRWEFEGKLAPEQIREKYRYKSIKKLFERGAVNPIRFLRPEHN